MDKENKKVVAMQDETSKTSLPDPLCDDVPRRYIRGRRHQAGSKEIYREASGEAGANTGGSDDIHTIPYAPRSSGDSA